MKKNFALLIFATLLCCIRSFSLQAQESIVPLSLCRHEITPEACIQPRSQPSLMTVDGLKSVEYPFSLKEQKRSIYALAVDLSVTFTRADGYFSVILEDQEGKQYLVYRDVACFNQLNVPISFPLKSFETAFLASGICPKKLILNTSDCQVELKKVHISTTSEKGGYAIRLHQKFSLERKRAIQAQITRINQYNKEHQVLWLAKETPLSNLSYAEIRKTFSHLNELEAYGLEHYGGGFYTPMAIPFDQLEFIDTTTAPYVESFDWNNRHGINWNSPCRRQQDTYSCWAQAVASALEGYIKRYYGRDENKEVSVLQIIACSGGLTLDSTHIATCGPGWTERAAEYLTEEPIVSEEDFPFTDNKYQPCENKPTNPLVSYQVERVRRLDGFDREQVMHTLINEGPIIASIPYHSMLLSGYGVVKPNLILDYWPKDTNPIPADHPLCGKVYWSFKNSFGEGFGNGGYSYFVRVKRKPVKGNLIYVSDIYGLYYLSGKLTESHRPNSYYIQYMIGAYDADGDGYYRWGLVGRPSNNTFIPEEQDGDDSDPLAGPMNEYGFCKELRKTDLYVRDVKQDKGVEPYYIDAPQWESPDIWVRQDSDKVEEHQNPNFGKNNQCYVYVRIHNKGIKPSNQRAMVRLYWSYASPTQWWESFHGLGTITIDGQEISSGGEIGTAVIPSIKAGQSSVVQIPWVLPKEIAVGMKKKELHACLMAEITDMQDPYYMVEHSDFRRYVQANNNVAQRNIHIVDLSEDNNDDEDNPIGNIRDILITNHGDKSGDFRFVIDCGENLNDYASFKDQLELSYSYNPICSTKSGGVNYQPIEFIPVDSIATIENIHLAPNEQQTIKLKTNFLVQKQTDQNEFKFRVKAIDAKTGNCIGGNTYIIRKSSRPLFSADVTIIDALDNGTELIAHEIGEPSRYSWSTSEGKEIATGKELSLPANTQLKDITLSVEATKDGFIDRKTVSLPQKRGDERSPIKLHPNPTDGILTIELVEAKQEGIITITSLESGKICYTSSTQGEKTLTADLSSLARGYYFLNYYEGKELVSTQEFLKL